MLTNSYLKDVNVSVGNTANGNCIDIMAFKISFIPVKWFISEKYARENVGAIAMVLVNNTLNCKILIFH